MKISFLVTYYNQEEYVDDSLRSIWELKKPREYEVLVGDDGSADATAEKVENWRKLFGGHLQVFRMERESDGEKDPVVRASNLRKFLLKKSTGDYFCILDGDDYYCDRNFIVMAMQIYEDYPTASVAMFNYQMVYPNRVQAAKPIPKEGVIEQGEYIRGYYKHAGGCVFKNPKKTEFFERMADALYYDDADIPVYNLCFGDLVYKDSVVYSYRQHTDSIWNSLSRAQQGILNMVGADNEVFLAPMYRSDIYYRFRTDILYTYFRRENQEKAVGEDFLERYRLLCADRPEYMSKALLDYKNAAKEQKDMVEEIISYIKTEDEELYRKIEDDCAVKGAGK